MATLRKFAALCFGRRAISGFLLLGAFVFVVAALTAVNSPSREVTIALDAGPVRLVFTLGESCPHRGEGRPIQLAR